jgi:hypothetical protein
MYRVLLSKHRLVIGSNTKLTSQTQAVQSVTVENRLVIGRITKPTRQILTVQSNAFETPACDWLKYETDQSNTSCTECYCRKPARDWPKYETNPSDTNRTE